MVANEALIQQMLDLMKEQMETIKTLRAYNDMLRTVTLQANGQLATPSATTSSEEDLLKYIKLVVVKTVHKAVHRQVFNSLK